LRGFVLGLLELRLDGRGMGIGFASTIPQHRGNDYERDHEQPDNNGGAGRFLGARSKGFIHRLQLTPQLRRAVWGEYLSRLSAESAD
jgi:hypothetical protein